MLLDSSPTDYTPTLETQEDKWTRDMYLSAQRNKASTAYQNDSCYSLHQLCGHTQQKTSETFKRTYWP